MPSDFTPQRGKPPKNLVIEIVRGLTEEDIPVLESRAEVTTQPNTLQAVRSSHHQLAQLIVQGRPDAEVALITGYSPSRISILKRDPTFQELLHGYQDLRQQVFVDTLERMKVLGLSTLDELQERLETEPERWSNRELMEMADLMLVKPKLATPMGAASSLGSAGSAATGVSVTVQFIKSETPPLTIDGDKT